MTLLLGIDLGTTKTTTIAVDAASGVIVAQATSATSSNTASAADQARGRSEFDVRQLTRAGLDCLSAVARQLNDRVRDVVGLGITGQQHGAVIVDRQLRPLVPFINWQDQRGNDESGNGQSYVEQANARIDAATATRTGCRLRTGFLATTLYWMKANGVLPCDGQACFLMDYFASSLTGRPLATDPSCAASAGVFDVPTRDWNVEALTALEISRDQLPVVREAHQVYGSLLESLARETGLPSGLPVFVPIGDHQACFVGSVADRFESALLNVGTGAQVAVFTPHCDFRFPMELRPFPISGNLLSFVGLSGGWSFQVVERFFHMIGEQIFGHTSDNPLYGRLTQLAAQEAVGAAGMSFVPTFSGTRANPHQRGALTNISAQSLTPGNLVRALLEGMTHDYRQAYELIGSVTGRHLTQLVTAGNGLRENKLLSSIVSTEIGLAPVATRHREEAAFGAALVAGVGAGVFSDLQAAGAIIHYESTM